MRKTREGHSKEQRLLHQTLEPAVVRETSMGQSKLGIPTCLAIDQRAYAELLREAVELPAGCRSFREIDEVGLHPPFGEESKRLSRVRALLRAENLNFHSCYHLA